MFKSGSVFLASQLIPMEELHRSEFYTEFLRPNGIEHLLCAVLFQERSLYGFLNLARPKEMHPFSGQEVALMQKLLPLLQQALMVSRTIARLASERAIANGLLDHMSRGIVLLDGRGKAVMANRAALRILEGRDGLMFEDNGIRAVIPEENQRLKHLLQSVLAGDRAAGQIPDSLLLVSRTGADSPLSVLIAPLGRDLPLLEEPQARAVAFISDPEQCPTSAEQVMRGLYSFTEAEARLAGCLLKGLSLEECSAHLGITLNTTRTHLKRLFLKTSTNRQGELIRILLESPAMLHLGHS
jgi:DNA-binding CsgD family transcriptional regulator/PAS domain-containing protein